MRFNIITARFEEEDRAPGKWAVHGSDRSLTWQEFHKEVQAMADLLHGLHLPAGAPVAIRGHKQASVVVAMAACIMHNHPYIPLDIMIPEDRVRRIFNIAGVQLLIDCSDVPLETELTTLQDNSTLKHGKAMGAGSTPVRTDDPLRYIIFTSGSTGDPKGVCISRSAAAAFLHWTCSDFGFSADDVFINQAPFSFDLSVYELFTSLYIGGTLLLNDAETTADSQRFIRRIQERNGSVWVSTPTFAYLYLTEPKFNAGQLPTVKTFLFCGEALPKMTAQRLLDRFPGSRVLNTYGPTEATVATSLVDVTAEVLDKYADMPVGAAMPGSRLITHTEDGAPATKELPGEILIIGDNVSTGYLANEALNAEKFFVERGKRGFRTGDFGWIEDGLLFFNGRRDEQVKLNGFRIELGDITAQMLAVDGVADAIALPLRSGGAVKRIVGFVRPLAGRNNTELRNAILLQIGKELPHYMIPGDISFVDAFPVNNNHKTDRKALIDGYLAQL
ncbi:MAG: AMP-binding protein [Flavobacteriales bacterium]|nr:AMP-binding protein [Flavobacteriales bacterium]